MKRVRQAVGDQDVLQVLSLTEWSSTLDTYKRVKSSIPKGSPIDIPTFGWIQQILLKMEREDYVTSAFHIAEEGVKTEPTHRNTDRGGRAWQLTPQGVRRLNDPTIGDQIQKAMARRKSKPK